jgi:thiamine kinase-like enzyme
MIIKELLGSGRTAEVFEIDDTKVLKLFNEYMPKSLIEYEFEFSYKAKELFRFAPKAYEIITYQNQIGIIYERVFGEELSYILQNDITKAKKFGREMGKLHSEMHKISSNNLPSQKNRYKNDILESKDILEDKANVLLSQLDSFEKNNILCHGDFHLGNIMFKDNNYYVIDWMNCCKGHPEADVCRTLIMFETPFIEICIKPEIKHLVKDIFSKLKKEYLNSYFQNSESTLDKVEKWRPIVAAARIKEKIPGELNWLLSMINI